MRERESANQPLNQRYGFKAIAYAMLAKPGAKNQEKGKRRIPNSLHVHMQQLGERKRERERAGMISEGIITYGHATM